MWAAGARICREELSRFGIRFGPSPGSGDARTVDTSMVCTVRYTMHTRNRVEYLATADISVTRAHHDFFANSICCLSSVVVVLLRFLCDWLAEIGSCAGFETTSILNFPRCPISVSNLFTRSERWSPLVLGRVTSAYVLVLVLVCRWTHKAVEWNSRISRRNCLGTVPCMLRLYNRCRHC